jgi:transcriptional antiterminator Rof (Rho-off)
VSDYRVIDCDLHDLYEVAVLRRRRLLLNWRDASGLVHLELLVPVDIQTTPDGEFLMARHADGRADAIRLDAILHARDPVSGEEFPVRPHQSGT